MLTGQSQIRLHANDVPNNLMGERRAHGKEEDSGTLAALPVRRPACWQDELPRYQALTSSLELKSDPLPATPERGSQRYKPRTVISQHVELLDLPAGQQTLLSALPPLPEGWRRHVHPEGNVFFYHEGLTLPKRIFTESDIIKREKEILFHATQLIQQAVQTGDVILDELTEIVLNVDDRHWYYYFVDHKHRLLFWVHKVPAGEHLGTDLQGITQYSHIRYLVEARYWYAPSGSLLGMSAPVYLAYDVELRSHCEYYPHNRTLPNGVFEDLRGMLNYAKTDMMTTDSSSSPFAQDELVAILDLVNSLKDDERISNPYSIWVIARIMGYFTENQFLNFCGQPCARLDADTPLFGKQTWNSGVVFKIVNVLLFGSPNEHAVRLQRVWVDGTIIQPRWKAFTTRTHDRVGPVYHLLMLAVNFSFLAMPGVIPTKPPASPMQVVIYCSAGFNCLGLMDASSAAAAMRTLSLSKPGMACLAITHSLPIACSIWSIVLFSTALAIQIFRPKELATITPLGVECLILVLSGWMSVVVMWLFTKNNDPDTYVAGFISMVVRRLFSRNDDANDADTSEENHPPLTGSQADSQRDLELGSEK
ncbi:hypothetical protein J3R83DRAFT_14022 [Lanmaoa asiatica]|nr:hypothetical protein J3R83DRAFT_14022 [Lanmaoa asiatica]